MRFFTYSVVWEAEDGFYCATFVSNGSPESMAVMWETTNYNGPYETRDEANAVALADSEKEDVGEACALLFSLNAFDEYLRQVARALSGMKSKKRKKKA